MTCLDTSETWTAEHMMNGNASISHGLPHQLGLDCPHYCQRTVPTEPIWTLPPLWHRDGHVEVFPLVSPLLVPTVGDPGTEGEVHPFPVTSDEELSGSRRTSWGAGADTIIILNLMTDIAGLDNLGIQTLNLQIVVRSKTNDIKIPVSSLY